MLRRITGVDRAAIAAVVLGAVAVFVPWYSYITLSSHVTVNGFRASLIGDIFFLVIAAAALLVLARLRLVDAGFIRRLHQADALVALAGLAAAAVFLQLVLNLIAGGRTVGLGFLLAFLSAMALALAAWVERAGASIRRKASTTLEESLLD